MLQRQLDKSLRDSSKKGGRNQPTKTLQEPKLARTHLIDGIYQGEVNQSYQRDGFGILLTDNFEAYIGFFKYNKPHGLGLIIYSDGSMIYGFFKAGSLEGIGLTDNGHQLQIGTLKDAKVAGVGYEYNYQGHGWKMSSYHRGVPIDTLREENVALSERAPNMLTLQPEILIHFMRYTAKTFFTDPTLELNSPVVEYCQHPTPDGKYYFGFKLGNHYEGAGILYDFSSKRVVESGIFANGKLQGFGKRIDAKTNSQEMGFYVEGKKEGVFYVVQNGQQKFIEFSKDKLVYENKRDETLQLLKKRMKIHNYRQKDFLSIRTMANISEPKILFESNSYKAWRIQQQSEKKEININRAKMEQDRPKPKQQPNTLPNGQFYEKPSVEVMREKMIEMISKKNGKGQKGQNQGINVFDPSSSMKIPNEYNTSKETDDIAVQENPITAFYPSLSDKKKKVNFTGYDQHYNINQ